MPRSPIIALLALGVLAALLYLRVRLVVDPREAVLEVRVQGAAVATAVVVRVEGVGLEAVHERPADARGVARFEGLAPGFYDVTAAGGGQGSPQAVRVRLSPGRHLGIEVPVVRGPVRR